MISETGDCSFVRGWGLIEEASCLGRHSIHSEKVWLRVDSHFVMVHYVNIFADCFQVPLVVFKNFFGSYVRNLGKKRDLRPDLHDWNVQAPWRQNFDLDLAFCVSAHINPINLAENVTLSEELGGACVSHCRAIPTRVNGRGIWECTVELVIIGVLALSKTS